MASQELRGEGSHSPGRVVDRARTAAGVGHGVVLAHPGPEAVSHIRQPCDPSIRGITQNIAF